MSIVNEKYNAARINLLHQMLVNDCANGQPRDYEIKVDELRVVQRTSDPERYFQHEEFVQPDTRCVTISIYDGNSRKCTRYQLYFNEVPQQQHATLSGVEDIVREKIEQHKQQLNKEQLEKKCTDLQEQLDEAEEYQEKLEKQIEELKQKKFNIKDQIGDIASHALEDLFLRNAKKLKHVPVLGGLAGLMEAANASNELTGNIIEQSDGQANFSKKKPTENWDSSLTDVPAEQQKVWCNNGQWLQTAFTEPDYLKVVSILKILSTHPQSIDDTLELLQDEVSPDDNNDHSSQNEQPVINEGSSTPFNQATIADDKIGGHNF